MKNRFLNKKECKPAMTMAEIMIVVLIVAIISIVFIAMPRKNVSKMDKAKYYIAYDMLKRLQDEQMVNNGKVKIDPSVDAGDSPNRFIDAVDEWLNTLPDTPTCRRANRCVPLTNGMMISWRTYNNIATRMHYPLYLKKSLRVKVDVDGGDSMGTLNEDVYYFKLYENGWVAPVTCYKYVGSVVQEDDCLFNDPNEITLEGNVNIRLPFRVYRYNDDGSIVIIKNNVGYKDAYQVYECSTNNNARSCPVGAVCADGKCIMEAIPPLR